MVMYGLERVIKAVIFLLFFVETILLFFDEWVI